MAYSRFIHDYLDGELNEAQKDALFAQLAGSTELRTEFEQQVKLQSLASYDMSTISAPIDSTNYIFSSLGFSIPSGQSAPPAFFGSGFFNSRGSLIVSIILLISLSSVLFFTGNYFGSNGILKFDDYFGSKNAIPVVSSFENESDNKSLETNKSGFQKGNYFSSANAGSFSTIDFQSKKNNAVSAVDNSESQADNTRIVHDGYSVFENTSISIRFAPEQMIGNEYYASTNIQNGKNNSGGNFNAVNSNFGNDLLINDPDFYDEWKEIREKKFSININTFMTDAGTYHNIPGQNYGSFSDVSFSLAWNKDENHSFMISGGKEKYPLSYKYNGTTEYQNPDRNWIGLSYRYNVTSMNIAGLIYPYAQMTAGATSIGPVFRPQTGLIMRPSPSLSITFGAEYNVLVYDVSGKKYLSDKFSLAYGLNYHF